MLTNASAQWVPFNQIGDYFMWATEAVDASAIASANSSWNVTLSVPRGLNLRALINTRVNYVSAPGTMTFSSLLVPNSLGTATVLSTATNVYAQLELMTDTSAQIRGTGECYWTDLIPSTPTAGSTAAGGTHDRRIVLHLIVLHTVDGREISVNPKQVTSLHASRDD